MYSGERTATVGPLRGASSTSIGAFSVKSMCFISVGKFVTDPVCLFEGFGVDYHARDVYEVHELGSSVTPGAERH